MLYLNISSRGGGGGGGKINVLRNKGDKLIPHKNHKRLDKFSKGGGGGREYTNPCACSSQMHACVCVHA